MWTQHGCRVFFMDWDWQLSGEAERASRHATGPIKHAFAQAPQACGRRSWLLRTAPGH